MSALAVAPLPVLQFPVAAGIDPGYATQVDDHMAAAEPLPKRVRQRGSRVECQGAASPDHNVAVTAINPTHQLFSRTAGDGWRISPSGQQASPELLRAGSRSRRGGIIETAGGDPRPDQVREARGRSI